MPRCRNLALTPSRRSIYVSRARTRRFFSAIENSSRTWSTHCSPDPNHPRAEMQEDLRILVQLHHTECFAQLAVFAPACEALRQDPLVIPALQAVAEVGLSAEARDFARQR